MYLNFFYEIQLIHSVSGVEQSDSVLIYLCIYMYVFFLRFLSIIGYYKILDKVSSRSLLLIYFIPGSVYLLIPNSQFIPPPSIFIILSRAEYVCN